MKKTKGQIAIEFIIIIAIFLLFFYSMILPTINFSENIIKDTYTLTQSKKGISDISRSVEELDMSPGYGKRSMFLYLPNTTYITGCDNTSVPKKILGKTKLEQDPGIHYCDGNALCDINVSVYTNLDLDCNSIPSGFKGYITIEKTNTGEIKIYD